MDRGANENPTNAPLGPLPATFATAVSSLHRVAEALVAPARKPDNEIALEATPGGFGTPEFEFAGALQQVRVEGAELVRVVDGVERRASLGTLAEAGAVLDGLLPRGGELPDDQLHVDPAASRALGAWYGFGAELLGELVAGAAPGDEATPPRLWPEHFDIAIELGSEAGGVRANFGLSPGDEGHPQPYVYVGPWSAAVSGDLWRARGFSGAELDYAEILAATDQRRCVSEFFTSRRDDLANFKSNGETK